MEISGERVRFFERDHPPKRRHDGASAFDDDPRSVSVGARLLPNSVGEIGYVGDIPDASAVDSMAADAISIEEIHNDTPLLLGAPYPKPRSTHLNVANVAGSRGMPQDTVVRAK